MKKYLAALLAALVVMMAGCGGKAAPETTAAPTEPTVAELPFETEADARVYAGVELNFWSVLPETDPQAQVMIQAAEVFEKNTGAQVAFTWQAGAVSETSDVDIFQTDVDTLAALTCAQDLTGPADAAEYVLSSFMVLRQRVTDSCGTLMGIPFTPRLEGLYYNRQAFESCGITEIPGSWEDFLAVCDALNASGYYALAMNTEDGAKVVQAHLESALGAAQLAALLEEKKLSEDETAANACQQLIDFEDAGHVYRGDYPAGQNRVALSAVSMTFCSNETLAEIENDTLTDLTWGVMGWPAGGGAYADCDVLAVHSSCENLQAAFDFILLLTTGEYDQLRAEATGGIPADPNNEGPIAGAAQTMAGAQPGRASSGSQNYLDLATRLWNGKYKTGSVFATALEQLKNE